MRNQDSYTPRTGSCRPLVRLLTFAASALSFILLPTAASALQDSPAMMATTPKKSHAATGRATGHTQDSPASQKPDLGEYGPLLTEFGHLAAKIQEGVQTPAPRTQSKLLPLLPQSTSVVLSVANYGETLYQANQIFNQGVQESPALKEWWDTKVGVAGMMVGGVVEQVHQFMGYLGDEILVSGSFKPKTNKGSFLILAEIRKPGLKAFLQPLLDQYGGKNSPVQILTPQQLLTAKAGGKSTQLLMLIRPDFLVASSELSTLRSINAQLNRGPSTFSATPFAQRMAQSYRGGVNMLVGADLQQLLAMRPPGKAQEEAIFKQTGFADLKYLILDGKSVGGASTGNMELTFNGPRQGIASWLGAPTNLGGLDFVSPNAMVAEAFALKSPAQMFDDIKLIAGNANPMASMGLAQMESQFKINLKDDLFSKLGGELAFALEDLSADNPAWKVMAQVSDANGLQKILQLLLAGVSANATDGKGLTVEQKTEDGLTYSSVGFFSKDKPQEVAYTFADGYLVVASTPALLKEAIQMHRTGASLAKSSDFRRLLPSEHGGQASALIFQNTASFLAAMTKQLSPEITQMVQSLLSGGQNQFNLTAVYGEPAAIHASSNSQQLNVLVPLVVAAVAIPNLLRAKTAANETAAAATVRTLNTAEVTYQVQYGKFAPDLASLGSGPDGACDKPTEQNACILDGKLAAPNCSSGNWCTKDNFQYTIVANCDGGACQDYVVVATPNGANAGQKSYCSTSDAVVRSKPGPPLAEPISAVECQTWKPI